MLSYYCNEFKIDIQDFSGKDSRGFYIRKKYSFAKRMISYFPKHMFVKIFCVKQPVIARMDKTVHSPQINSLLKIPVPLGYTLKIVPTAKKV